MGHITKQGNTLLRWLLVEAAIKAVARSAWYFRRSRVYIHFPH